MISYSVKTELRDGTLVLLRPVESDDKHLFEIGFEHFSKQSRYLRFFRPVSKLSAKDLEYFSAVDQINHIAIGAIDMGYEKTFPIGVARCIRMKGRPDEAEVAFAIVDSHQGRGLGTILLAAITHAALAQNITIFRATILATNRTMIEFLRQPDTSTTIEMPGVLSMRTPIHKNVEWLKGAPAGDTVKNIYNLLDRAQSKSQI